MHRPDDKLTWISHFSVFILLLLFNDPIICKPIRTNDDDTHDDFLQILFGEDADFFRDFSKVVRNPKESLDKLQQIKQRMHDKEERLRNERKKQMQFEERQATIIRNRENRRRELEHEQRSKDPEWYQVLFSWSLPGQLYSLYTYLKF